MQTRIPESLAVTLDMARSVVGARSRTELLGALADVLAEEVRAVPADPAAAIDPQGLVARLRRTVRRRAEEQQAERMRKLRGRLSPKQRALVDSADQVTEELREAGARRVGGGC